MKSFLAHLLSDSNKVSSKRFIGLLALIMFIVYGIAALFRPFALEFWIFYVSLCAIMIWIAFKFMSSEKILKYNVLSKLSNFNKMKDVVDSVVDYEGQIDNSIQPELPQDAFSNDKKD
jgi:hypothetical protein